MGLVLTQLSTGESEPSSHSTPRAPHSVVSSDTWHTGSSDWEPQSATVMAARAAAIFDNPNSPFRISNRDRRSSGSRQAALNRHPARPRSSNPASSGNDLSRASSGVLDTPVSGNGPFSAPWRELMPRSGPGGGSLSGFPTGGGGKERCVTGGSRGTSLGGRQSSGEISGDGFGKLTSFEHELLKRMQVQQEIVDSSAARALRAKIQPSISAASPAAPGNSAPESVLTPTSRLLRPNRSLAYDSLNTRALSNQVAAEPQSHRGGSRRGMMDNQPTQRAHATSAPVQQQGVGIAAWQLPGVPRTSGSERLLSGSVNEIQPMYSRDESPTNKRSPKTGSQAKAPRAAQCYSPSATSHSAPRTPSISAASTSSSGSGGQTLGLAACKAASRAALSHVRSAFSRSQSSLKHVKRMEAVHCLQEETVVLDDATRGLITLRQQLFKVRVSFVTLPPLLRLITHTHIHSKHQSERVLLY